MNNGAAGPGFRTGDDRPESGNGRTSRVMEWTWRVVAVMLVPLALFLINLNSRTTVIESNRFTSGDALQLEIRLRQEMNARLERIEDKLDAVIREH